MAARERLIALVKALNEYTDEEHPLSAGKLCAILAQHGIAANRRSIYADVAALNRMGWKIESTTRGYYANDRPFTAEDARLIMLALDCAPFMDEATAQRLRQGIAKTQSVNFESPAGIERTYGAQHRLRSAIETITLAIDAQKQLSYVPADCLDDTDIWPREKIEPICLIYAGGEFVLRAAVNGGIDYIPLNAMFDIKLERRSVKHPSERRKANAPHKS